MKLKNVLSRVFDYSKSWRGKWSTLTKYVTDTSTFDNKSHAVSTPQKEVSDGLSVKIPGQKEARSARRE